MKGKRSIVCISLLGAIVIIGQSLLGLFDLQEFTSRFGQLNAIGIDTNHPYKGTKGGALANNIIGDNNKPAVRNFQEKVFNDKGTTFSEITTIREFKLNCSTSTNLPRFWCLEEEHQRPRYIGSRLRQEHSDNWPPPSDSIIVKRYTHDGYEQCLANKTVVFIGDSRVRYQFMHLASFLQSRRWMKCQDYYDYNSKPTNTADNQCFLIDYENHQHMTGDKWKVWFQESTQMLASSSSNSSRNNNNKTKRHRHQQYSHCDCYRPVPFDPAQSYENRFVKRFTANGDEINLIFLQNFENSIRLNQQYPPYSPFFVDDEYIRCKTGECGPENRTDKFQGNLQTTLWKVLPRLYPTHAFVNLGWEYLFGKQEQSQLSCQLQDFQDHFHNQIKMFLITHPPRLKAKQKASYNANQQLECNDIGVLDRTTPSKGVPKSWYWDEKHVLSILNEEFNHEMMELLCPMP